MAVAHGAVSESHTGTTGSTSQASFSWTHAGGATPRGVLVFTFNNTSTGDAATGVTYGGVALAAVSGGRAVDTTGEPGDCKAWFLGSGIPTGNQTVVVNRTNNTDVLYAVAITVTAAADTEIKGAPALVQNDGTWAIQSVDAGVGVQAQRYSGAMSGSSAVDAAGSNTTTLSTAGGIDLGSRVACTYRETASPGGTGAVSIGPSSATADDRAGVYVAIGEAAASGSSGSLSSTLDAATLASTGTVAVSGTLSSTLGALTSAGAAAVAVTGTTSATLGALTLAGTATLAAVGSLSATLGAVAVSGAGALAVAGTLTSTLGAVTLTASGTVANAAPSGTLDQTLGSLSASASGTVAISGSLSATLAVLTIAAAGGVAVSGSASAALAALTVSAAGQVPITGSAELALDAIALSAAGHVAVTGSLAATLGAATLAGTGSGQSGIFGSLSVALGATTSSGSGAVTVAGQMTATLEPLTGSAHGGVEVSGAGAVSLDGLTGSAAGQVPIEGGLDATLGILTLAASGAVVDAGLLAKPRVIFYTLPEDRTFRLRHMPPFLVAPQDRVFTVGYNTRTP